MYINDEKWNEIIGTTSIDNWNAAAAERGCSDTFRCKVIPGQTHCVILTEHWDGSRADRKAIARELATGGVRAAKAKAVEDKIKFVVKTPDPKAWRMLPTLSTGEIVKRLRLADFSTFISAAADPEPDITTYQVFGFRRDGHGVKVCTLVDVPRGDPTSPTAIAVKLFGYRILFPRVHERHRPPTQPRCCSGRCSPPVRSTYAKSTAGRRFLVDQTNR